MLTPPDHPPRRTALLFIRIWWEPEGGTAPARILSTSDVSEPNPAAEVVVGADAVQRVVKDWLERFVAGSHGDGDGDGPATGGPV